MVFYKKILIPLALTICCFAGGFAYYKVNNGDAFNAIAFTVGILGIMLSVLRESKKKDKKRH